MKPCGFGDFGCKWIPTCQSWRHFRFTNWGVVQISVVYTSHFSQWQMRLQQERRCLRLLSASQTHNSQVFWVILIVRSLPLTLHLCSWQKFLSYDIHHFEFPPLHCLKAHELLQLFRQVRSPNHPSRPSDVLFAFWPFHGTFKRAKICGFEEMLWWTWEFIIGCAESSLWTGFSTGSCTRDRLCQGAKCVVSVGVWCTASVT